MSSKKSYNRFFIILQEEDRGYGMGPDRLPTGYVKVETKNDKSRVTVYAQNLKPFESGEYLYRCYLISHQDGRDSSAYLGIMNIDESGRGESSWESGSEDAFNSKVPVDKFNAAAIVADKAGVETVIAPLAGYMSKEKFEWRSKISKVGHIAEQEASEETAEEEKNKAEAEKFAQYEKKIEEDVKADAVSQVIEGGEPSPVSAPVVEPELKPVVESDEKEFIEKENLEEVRGKHKHHEEYKKKKHEEHEEKEEHEEYMKEMHEEHEECEHEEHEECKEHMEHEDHEHHMEYDKHECHDDEDYYIKIRLTMCRALEGMLRDCKRMEEQKGLKGCSVWKVDMEKCRRDGYMVRMYPYYDLLFYPMMYNPEVNYFKYIARHGHYLFGIKYGKKGEVDEIIFGIKGKRRAEDQPFKGRTGFIRWISYSGDDDGYWLMMYDPITGIVNLSE